MQKDYFEISKFKISTRTFKTSTNNILIVVKMKISIDGVMLTDDFMIILNPLAK